MTGDRPVQGKLRLRHTTPCRRKRDDSTGQFVKERFSYERRKMRKKAREMREVLGMTPAPILSEELEQE